MPATSLDSQDINNLRHDLKLLHTTVSVTMGVGVQPRGGCELGRPENAFQLNLDAWYEALRTSGRIGELRIILSMTGLEVSI